MHFALRLLLDNLILNIIDTLAKYFLQLVLLIDFFGTFGLYVTQVLLLLLKALLEADDLVLRTPQLWML